MKTNNIYITFSLYSAAFLILMVIAGQYYEERLFGESGLDVLCVVNRESFCILWGRYSMFFGQLLPVAMLKLHMPLKLVLIGFSIAPFLFYYLLFAVCHLWLKDEAAGLGFLILLTINVNSAYFLFPMADIQYGAAILIVIHSMINHLQYSHIRMIIIGILLFFVIYSHPLIIGVLLALMAFNLLGSGKKPELKWMVALGCLTAVFLIVRYLLFPDPYDVSKMDSQVQMFSLSSGFDLRHFASFWSFNKVTVILSILVFCFYLMQKQFIKLFVYLVGFLAIYFLLYTTVPEGGASEYHLAYGGLLTGVLLFPLAYDMTDRSLKKWIRWPTVLFILSGCIADQQQISRLSSGFTDQISMMDHMITYAREQGYGRAIIKNETTCVNCLQPYYHQHSLLMSGQDGPHAAVQLEMEEQIFRDYYNDSLMAVLDMDKDSNLVYYMERVEPKPNKARDAGGRYDLYQYHLNDRYFQDEDTVYHILAKEDTNSYEAIQGNIGLEFISKEYLIGQYGYSMPISFRLKNRSPHLPVYGGSENRVTVEFQWTDLKSNKVIRSDTHPLYADVHRDYTHFLILEVPLESNQCRLRAILKKDERPLDAADSIRVDFN